MKVIKHKDKWYLQSETGYKEILLSTDDSLIKDGVQAIDDEFLEWFVQNPNCEYVEVKSKVTKDGVWTDLKGYVELPTIHSISYKIIIPKEEPKQGTMSEAIKQVIDNQLKQETLEDKIFQQKLVDGLKSGKLLYQDASIYTIILELVQGNGKDEIFRIFNEVTKEEPDYTALLQPVGTKQESFVERMKPLQEQWQQDMDKELMKQETLEEAAEKYINDDLDLYESLVDGHISYDIGMDLLHKLFTAGVILQQERSYSEEDMNGFALYILKHNVITPKEWFEQFKKK